MPIYDSVYAHIIKYIKSITYIVPKYGHQRPYSIGYSSLFQAIFKAGLPCNILEIFFDIFIISDGLEPFAVPSRSRIDIPSASCQIQDLCHV